jgi:hypothetical protein
MPITKKIRDLLIPLDNYAVTSSDKTLAEAIHCLRKIYCETELGKCTEAGHRSMLVIDGKKELVGALDFQSILAVLIPEVAGKISSRLESLGVSLAYAEAGTPNLDETRLSFRARVLKNAETKVGDIMLKIRGTIQVDDDLLDALKAIHRNKITMLPVFEGTRLLGVIRDSDLFLAVADIFSE